MATYITSDAHGHLRALDQALEQAAPGADDTVYVLGDMIDRGPEPVGVINLVRSLPNVHVLMGNHERLMLNAIERGSQMDIFTWERNGGTPRPPSLTPCPSRSIAPLSSGFASCRYPTRLKWGIGHTCWRMLA